MSRDFPNGRHHREYTRNRRSCSTFVFETDNTKINAKNTNYLLSFLASMILALRFNYMVYKNKQRGQIGGQEIQPAISKSNNTKLITIRYCF